MKFPAPTMRMRRETMKAAEHENAIPRWADRRSLVVMLIMMMLIMVMVMVTVTRTTRMTTSKVSVDDVKEAPAGGHAAAQEKVEPNSSCAHQAGDEN